MPLVYTSETRVLALLECSINVNIDDIPRALSLTTIEIPDAPVKTVAIAELPGNWQAVPAPSAARDVVAEWFNKMNYAIVRVPSPVLAYEYNYLLNPLHPFSGRWKMIAVHDFVYDVRIKLQ